MNSHISYVGQWDWEFPLDIQKNEWFGFIGKACESQVNKALVKQIKDRW